MSSSLRPHFWIVAGPNGAGKTTCVQRDPLSKLLPVDFPFINPDDITRQKLRSLGFTRFSDAPGDVLRTAFIDAAEEAEKLLTHSVHSGKSIGVETVLSTTKYCSLVETARTRGSYVGLIYVALSSSNLSCERVASRVRQGGHDVPTDRLASRWQRSLDLLPWFIERSTDFWVIDNSDSTRDNVPPIVTWGSDGRVDYLDPKSFPELQSRLLPLAARNC